jgi:protein-tyrosine phosphatase
MRATTYPIPEATPYRLAIVARPRGNDWLTEELAAMAGEGIDVLVSMLTPEEAEELGLNLESAECASANMTFVNIPIPDRSVPKDKDWFVRNVDHVAALMRQGKSVGVHCRASIGRSSVLAVSVLVRLGWEPNEAFEAVQMARGSTIPDTPEQRKWVLDNVTPDELQG